MIAPTAEPFVLARSPAALKAVLANLRSTHYEVLGVSPGACDEASLKAARSVLTRLFHPDRNEDRRAHDYTTRANAAYVALSTPSERKHYDATLRSTHVPCNGCAGAGFKLKSVGFTKQTRLRCLGCEGFGWNLKPGGTK